jgi:gliding motility-associated protein GldL
MGKRHESKLDYFYRVVAPKLTNVGAAVVIVGAMFKILHLPGASEMLGAGLITEAVLFFIGAFQPAPPPDAHYEWERVYPGLVDDNYKPELPQTGVSSKGQGMAVLAGLDDMLKEANLSTESFKSFGKGITTLNESVLKMRDMSDAVAASNDYSTNLKEASKSLVSLNKTYATTLASMSEMANASKDAKEYHSQVQLITKNLGALNAVYEMELKDANSHLKAMNKFYSNLTLAMESMADASKESQVFKEQMSKLTTNITSLNKIYGNMLTAMKG